MTPDPRQSLDAPSSVDTESLEASFLAEDVMIRNESEPIEPEGPPLKTLSDMDSEPHVVTTRPRPRRAWGWILFVAGVVGLGWLTYTKIMAPAGGTGRPGLGGPLPVSVTQPQTATVQDKGEYIATLESRASVDIQPQAAGRITQIFVKSGDRVQTGTPLLRLDAKAQEAQVAGRQAEVDAARANIVAAQASLESARRSLKALQSTLQSRRSDLTFRQQEFDRFKTLQEKGVSSLQVLQERRSDLDQAKASVSEIQAQISTQEAIIAQAQADVVRRQQERDAAIATANRDRVQLRQFTIKAPISGTVGSIPAKVGDLVNESTPLLSLTQNQSLDIAIDVPQEEVNQLAIGMPVQLLDTSNQVIQTGAVSFISPEVNSATQSVLVKAKFNNADGTLRTNQMIKARIIRANRASVLVPTTAISRLAGKSFVFIAERYDAADCPSQGEATLSPEQWVAIQKPVELGPIINNSQDILKGLSIGDRVITSGLLQLQNCMPIQPNP